MKTAQQWFDEYAESHQNPVNTAVHWICVPVIFYAVISLLALIELPFSSGVLAERWLNVGSLVIVLGMVFYFSMSLTIALGMLLVSVGVLLLHQSLHAYFGSNLVWFNLLLFALAWVGQFIGHHIEGKKPSFLKDLQFLLVGPAWLLGKVYRTIGLSL